jgi:hypothetical protein
MCYIRFGAYPNHIHIHIIEKKNLLKKERKKKKGGKNRKEKHNSTDYGLMLGFADLKPDY